MKNIAYVRGSTDLVNLDNQVFEINNFCDKNNITIDEWVKETVSGGKDYSVRKLGDLLDVCDKNSRIICTEISRIGRSLMSVFDFLNKCRMKGCEVWTIKDNFRLQDDLTSQVVAFAYSLAAEIERSLISQRTKEALALRKSQGMKLGAPQIITDETQAEIARLKRSGKTCREIASILGIGKSSVSRLLNKSCKL